MTDYISRADSVKTVIRKCSPICDWQVGTQQYPDCVVAEINALPSAEAEWIPCSERLPSVSDDYLCTIPLDADETYTRVLTFHKGRFYEDDDEWGATYHDDVLAWMPLPKPYKGGDSE